MIQCVGSRWVSGPSQLRVGNRNLADLQDNFAGRPPLGDGLTAWSQAYPGNNSENCTGDCWQSGMMCGAQLRCHRVHPAFMWQAWNESNWVSFSPLLRLIRTQVSTLCISADDLPYVSLLKLCQGRAVPLSGGKGIRSQTNKQMAWARVYSSTSLFTGSPQGALQTRR